VPSMTVHAMNATISDPTRNTDCDKARPAYAATLPPMTGIILTGDG